MPLPLLTLNRLLLTKAPLLLKGCFLSEPMHITTTVHGSFCVHVVHEQ